jgi:hypothetical protein
MGLKSNIFRERQSRKKISLLGCSMRENRRDEAVAALLLREC